VPLPPLTAQQTVSTGRPPVGRSLRRTSGGVGPGDRSARRRSGQPVDALPSARCAARPHARRDISCPGAGSCPAFQESWLASPAEVSEYLVGSAAFKAVGTGDPRPAGSIPVHLRQRVHGRPSRTAHIALPGLLCSAVGGRPWMSVERHPTVALEPVVGEQCSSVGRAVHASWVATSRIARPVTNAPVVSSLSRVRASAVISGSRSAAAM